MRIMRICFITYKFPGKHNSTDYAFVKQLVDAIASLGNHCIVLAPFNISHYKKLSVAREEYPIGKGLVSVFRPGYVSFSTFHIGSFKPSEWCHKRALNRAFRMLDSKPDIIYGHFWNSAYDGFQYAKKNNIPLFVATGESELKEMFTIKADHAEFRDYISGVICVSSKNRNESISLGFTTPEKCQVFPNSINASLFRQLDRSLCRKQLGYPQDAFIVSFVGWFIDRKGPLRVSNAIKLIQGEPVYSLFIGKGEKGVEEQTPDCANILFKGALPHDQIPLYLNASDVFVLPTLNEGCCNAVVEAMACGLPIVSSNRKFNWDVLNETNSILIEPNSIEEIARAIQILRDDGQMRRKLSHGALEMAKKLTIEKRARDIFEFIQSKM